MCILKHRHNWIILNIEWYSLGTLALWNSWTRAQDALHFDAGVEVIVMEFWIVKRFILSELFSTLGHIPKSKSAKVLNVSNVDEVSRLCHVTCIKTQNMTTTPYNRPHGSVKSFRSCLLHLRQLPSERRRADWRSDVMPRVHSAPGIQFC